MPSQLESHLGLLPEPGMEVVGVISLEPRGQRPFFKCGERLAMRARWLVLSGSAQRWAWERGCQAC